MSPTIPAMITTFQTSGVSAGIVKWSCALRIPTTSPLSPSRITIGNSTRLRPTVRSSSAGLNSDPVKSGISHGAMPMKSSVMTVSERSRRPAIAAAAWSASRRRFCSSSSEKTGTKAELSAASATSARIRFGTWKASVNADAAPAVP